MFFMQMTEAFFVRTEPASSIVNPAHIHMTSAPQIRNPNVLSTNPVSEMACAMAEAGWRPRNVASPRIPNSFCMMIVSLSFVNALWHVTAEPKNQR